MKKNLNKKNIVITSFLLAFFAVSILFFINFRKDNKSTFSSFLSQDAGCQTKNNLTGECLTLSSKNLWPVSVMVDNHPDAWPQYGLNSAQIVYNTQVEGGATRMMAIFSSAENLKKIGPVRSVRPYYLTWVKGINSLCMHAGGSPEALQKIIDWKILDCNEITSYGPLYFFRDYGYSAPHNLFTSYERINLARQDWKLQKEKDFTVWKFNKNKTYQGDDAFEISIKYSQIYPYNIKYEYNTSTQKYFRFQNSQPQWDALEDTQIETKNLIIQFVPKEVHLDNADRLAIDTLGQGEMWYIVEGKKISGNWEKDDLNSRTKYYDEDGNEIIFLPGNFWVEVVPQGKQIIIK